MRLFRFILLFFAILPLHAVQAADKVELLNVSYDPTREFYEEYNTIFAKYWKAQTGKDIEVSQSHGGSGKQARSVIDGLKADVVTLALAYDIDEIATRGNLLPVDWQSKFPNNSAPYTSTIVFVVRADNPKNIKDWDDLVRDDVKVITPNPKTSGGARWNYLAAWAYASQKFGGDEQKTKEFMTKLYKNVPVLDTGARAATTTFVRRGIGDVLICWENEAYLALEEIKKLSPGKEMSIIEPSLSIKAEPPVAVVEKNAKQKGTLEVAQAYLTFLYSGQAQILAAKYHFRPSDKSVQWQLGAQFPNIKMVTINDMGGWQTVQKKHFNDGGIFDQFYTKK